MIEWSFIVTDRAGVSRAEFAPRGTKLTHRINGGHELAFTFPTLDAGAAEMLAGSRAVKAYRDGILRFFGIINEPRTTDPDWLSVKCLSPGDHYLPRRFLDANREFTSLDAGVIARTLIDDENATTRSFTYLDPMGTLDTTVTLSLVFEAGKSIGEIVRELATNNDAFWFREEPLEKNPNGYMTRLHITAAPGIDATPEAIFEYGRNTRGNLESVRTETLLPRNRIIARGSRASGEQLVATVEDTTSQDEYGILEHAVSFGDVQDIDHLQALAAGELRPNPIVSYTAEPLSDADDADLFVPSPWSNFEAGDTVKFYADHGALQVDGTIEIASFTLAISDDSHSERLDSLVLQELA